LRGTRDAYAQTGTSLKVRELSNGLIDTQCRMREGHTQGTHTGISMKEGRAQNRVREWRWNDNT
jgi:hypothetical protein